VIEFLLSHYTYEVTQTAQRSMQQETLLH